MSSQYFPSKFTLGPAPADVLFVALNWGSSMLARSSSSQQVVISLACQQIVISNNNPLATSFARPGEVAYRLPPYVARELNSWSHCRWKAMPIAGGIVTSQGCVLQQRHQEI